MKTSEFASQQKHLPKKKSTSFEETHFLQISVDRKNIKSFDIFVPTIVQQT